MGERSRTTIYLDQGDRDAIKVIREENGIATDAGAVRFAIRQVARELGRKPKRGQKPASGEAGPPKE